MSEWISVAERLPDNSSYILVACQGGHVTTTFYCTDPAFFNHQYGYKISRRKHGKQSKYFEVARKYGYRITHWQPLPPPPEV